MPGIEDFLRQYGISYERTDHPPVFTCEEAERLLPDLPGAHTKNLFLRDGKGSRYFLVVVGYDKSADLKELKRVIGADKLSFGSPEKLKELLGVEPGSVTVLGLMADTGHSVEVFFDEPIWKADALQCHPLVNTATLVIPHDGMEKFLAATGHSSHVITVPARTPAPPASQNTD